MPLTKTEMQTCILGAWGVLCAQFAHYLSLNKRDSIWMKLFVAGLALMTTLKTLQSLAIMWIQNVTTFGDLEAGSNIWQKHWVWKVTILLEAATAFYVQLFFCRRLWAISRNAYVVVICIILFLLGLVTGVVASAAPAALCALINFAGNMKMNSAPALMMINFIANMALPQLYAWSAMWTLNSREQICLVAESCSYTINIPQTSAGGSQSSSELPTCHQHQDNPVVKTQIGQRDCPPQSMA
ncbi:hypothetical protein DFH08DRAFT_1041221 [Mycena albidolilacea]|uniref:Uncharacterized protein n=1 Tax=Mycena albidolilacea TaxID=1033008 RepID=A0AAD6ZBD7_9AGAR|nr:hypothetical protein DFH08DRAFT_1041221 [Mycena albidolilacea]